MAKSDENLASLQMLGSILGQAMVSKYPNSGANMLAQGALQRGQGAAQQAYLQKQQEEGDNGLGRVLGTVAGTVLGGPIGGTIGGEAGAAIGGHEVDADALANSLGQAANSLGQAAMGGVGQKQSILPDMETGGQLGIGGMDTGALPTMQTGAQLGAGKMKQVIGYDSSGNPIYSPM